VDAAKSGGQEVRVGEVFVECAEKIGFPGFGFFRQGNNYALRGRRRLPEEKMQLAGSKDGGLAYTKWDLEVQNGNSGLSHEVKRRLTKSQVAFNQVRAVKQVHSVKPSHTVRNVLIGVGITLAAIGIVFGVGVAVHGLG
jgi:hypothetical protein